MALMTTTTGAEFIPELWSGDVIMAFQPNTVMAGIVSRPSAEDEAMIRQMGDTVHYVRITDLSANNKAAGTPVNKQSPTETKVSLLIDKHKESSFEIEDILSIQAKPDLRAAYAMSAGQALGKAVDSDLTGLWSGLSQTVGVGAQLGRDDILDAVEKLDDANAPSTDRFLVIHQSQKKELLKIDEFVRADIRGDGSRALATGEFGELYGLRVFVSSQIALSGGQHKNLAFHKSAFLLGIQSAPRSQADYQLSDLAWLYVTDTLYGVMELRDTAAVVLASN
jgi:N4-gp56 family major capsid protein